MSVFVALCHLLIRFYPRPFREEFGVEMKNIFQEQMEEAAVYGRTYLLQTCWRELRDWPLSCFQAHWQLRQQRLAVSTTAPPSWWDTAVAGLPYFLFALIVSSSALIFLFGRASGLFVSLLLSYGFIFLLLLVLIVAWWRGWPVWSTAWLGFLFFVLLVLFVPGQLFNLLGQPAQMFVSEVVFPLLWLAVLYVLLTRWPRSGLVAMLPPFGIAWLLYLEFVPENIRLVVMAVAWVWLGIVAIVLLRWQHHEWDVWLLYLAGAVAGAIYIYAGHFLTEMPVRKGTFAGMGENLLSELIPVLIPLVGILLLHTLRWWSQLNGRTAVHSYRFLLTGVLVTAIGLQTTLMTSTSFNFAWPGYSRFLFTAVFLFGCLLLVDSIRLLVINRKQWSLANKRPFWLLIILLLLLPLLVNFRWLNIVGEVGQIWLINRLASILWLVLAAWLVGTFRQQLPPIPTEEKNGEPSTAVPLPDSPTSAAQPGMSRWQKLILVVSLILLPALLLPATTLAVLFPNNQTQPFDFPTAFPLFLTMTAGLVMVAGLLYSGFQRRQAGAGKTAVFFFSLSAFLLATALRNYYWLAIWDSTYDGLGFLWLFIPFMGIFLATIWLMVMLPKRAKLVAFFYLLFLPPALLMITARTYSIDFTQLTERRAERVSQAINAYYDQEGHYPGDLHELSPRYIFALSEPMVIFGQDWCYESEGEQYQFGYVFREHWSSPHLVGYVHSATDEVTNLPPLCEEEITRLYARDPGYYSLNNK